MAGTKVEVIRESDSGLNERVKVNGVEMTNNQAYGRAIRGEIDGYHGVKRQDGTKFIRSNPDGNKSNNLG